MNRWHFIVLEALAMAQRRMDSYLEVKVNFEISSLRQSTQWFSVQVVVAELKLLLSPSPEPGFLSVLRGSGLYSKAEN